MTITTYSNVTTYKLSQISYKIHDESTLLADFEPDSATRLSSVICTQLKCSAAITDWKREINILNHSSSQILKWNKKI